MTHSVIKKIAVNQLKVGMYLHDLSCGWMDHLGYEYPAKWNVDPMQIAGLA